MFFQRIEILFSIPCIYRVINAVHLRWNPSYHSCRMMGGLFFVDKKTFDWVFISVLPKCFVGTVIFRRQPNELSSMSREGDGSLLISLSCGTWILWLNFNSIPFDTLRGAFWMIFYVINSLSNFWNRYARAICCALHTLCDVIIWYNSSLTWCACAFLMW